MAVNRQFFLNTFAKKAADRGDNLFIFLFQLFKLFCKYMSFKNRLFPRSATLFANEICLFIGICRPSVEPSLKNKTIEKSNV